MTMQIMNNFLKKTFTLLLFLALPFAGVYAQTNYNGEEMAQKITNQSKVVTVSALQSRIDNGLLHVHAEVLNSSGQKIHLYYRTMWHNAQKQQVNADSWKPLLLLPNKSRTINATSPLSNATDFSLELKAD